MRRILFPLLGVLMALAFSGDQHPLASARQPDDPAAKLRAIQEQRATLQKQLKDLAKQEQALRKELEERAKALRKEREERAKEKDYYIKVEAKGRLRKEMVDQIGVLAKREMWTITAQEMTWELDLSKNKELLETAKQCEGKTVLITGKLARKPDRVFGSTFMFHPMHVLVVATLKPAP
ncbi:MAG: hypothetical protein ACRELG_06745 [Gemmataceae bacterium]